ncbi:cache domain-containing protein [Hydrogenispora sp. UU3]|uniref:Cache domain-containing protein n=2 Tax=Capillibacterium thermochitinicola TaxID=2699427 RepID=A0A8J6HX26_9FIRM|nr:cache domain-containing protein [Capillibacterium thermochitinicola]
MNCGRINPTKEQASRKQPILQRISVRKILFCLLIVLTLTPVLIVDLISQGNFKRAVTDKVTRYSLAELTQAVNNIQTKLAAYEAISLQLFVNNDFLAALEKYYDHGDKARAAAETVKACFNEYMKNNADLYGFMFVSASDRVEPLVVTRDWQQDFHDLSRQFKETHAYRSIMEADGGIVWAAPWQVNRSNYLLLGRLFKRISTGARLGIIAIVIDEEKIDHLVNLAFYHEFNNSWNGIEKYSLLINRRGEIISSPFKEDIGKKATQLIDQMLPTDGANVAGDETGKGQQGSFIATFNQEQNFVTYKAVGRNGWYLVNLVSASFLYKERRVVTVITLVLCLFFGALALCLSLYLTKRVGKERR